MHKVIEHCFGEVRAGPGGCAVLKTARCEGYRTCPFYKTVRESRLGIERANARLRSLSLSEQINIAHKYYSGHMPWHRRLENE